MKNATWRQRAQHCIDKALEGVTTRDLEKLDAWNRASFENGVRKP